MCTCLLSLSKDAFLIYEKAFFVEMQLLSLMGSFTITYNTMTFICNPSINPSSIDVILFTVMVTWSLTHLIYVVRRTPSSTVTGTPVETDNSHRWGNHFTHRSNKYANTFLHGIVHTILPNIYIMENSEIEKKRQILYSSNSVEYKAF